MTKRCWITWKYMIHNEGCSACIPRDRQREDTRQIRRGLDDISDHILKSELFWKTFEYIENVILSVNQ